MVLWSSQRALKLRAASSLRSETPRKLTYLSLVVLPHDSLALCRLTLKGGGFPPCIGPCDLRPCSLIATSHLLNVTSLSFCGSLALHPCSVIPAGQKSWTSVTYQGQNCQEGEALLWAHSLVPPFHHVASGSSLPGCGLHLPYASRCRLPWRKLGLLSLQSVMLSRKEEASSVLLVTRVSLTYLSILPFLWLTAGLMKTVPKGRQGHTATVTVGLDLLC